jgi:hypothetical protein
MEASEIIGKSELSYLIKNEMKVSEMYDFTFICKNARN